MTLTKDLPGRISVHGLIYNKDKHILVAVRSELDVDEKGCWDPPGGGIEEGESIEKGFIRELEEEMGIKASNIKVFGAHEVDDGSMDILVSAECDTEKVDLSEEHSEFKWVSEADILSLKPASLHLRAIQTLLKSKMRILSYEDTP